MGESSATAQGRSAGERSLGECAADVLAVGLDVGPACALVEISGFSSRRRGLGVESGHLDVLAQAEEARTSGAARRRGSATQRSYCQYQQLRALESAAAAAISGRGRGRAHERLERGVATERHPLPGGDGGIEGEARDEPLDRVTEDHQQPRLGGGPRQQRRDPRGARVQRRPLSHQLPVRSREVRRGSRRAPPRLQPPGRSGRRSAAPSSPPACATSGCEVSRLYQRVVPQR